MTALTAFPTISAKRLTENFHATLTIVDFIIVITSTNLCFEVIKFYYTIKRRN